MDAIFGMVTSDTRPYNQATVEFLAVSFGFCLFATAGPGLLPSTTLFFGLFIGYFIRWRADIFRAELERASRIAQFLSHISKVAASATVEAMAAIAQAQLANFKAAALRTLMRRLQEIKLNLADYNLVPRIVPFPCLF